MKERRKFVRVPETSEITYRVVSGVKQEHFVTLNLSRGGVRFYVHEFIPTGSLLKIKIKLTKTCFTFEALAQIRWIEEDLLSERFEIGVKFVEISPNNLKYLTYYIGSSQKTSEAP